MTFTGVFGIMEIVKGQICFGLIETWDVLKCICVLVHGFQFLINRNMGCIEILKIGISIRLQNMINRNMGCIEISLSKCRI